MINARSFILSLSVAIGLAASTVATEAAAGPSASGYVSQVEYNFNNGQSFLFLELNGNTSITYEAPTLHLAAEV